MQNTDSRQAEKFNNEAFLKQLMETHRNDHQSVTKGDIWVKGDSAKRNRNHEMSKIKNRKIDALGLGRGKVSFHLMKKMARNNGKKEVAKKNGFSSNSRKGRSGKKPIEEDGVSKTGPTISQASSSSYDLGCRDNAEVLKDFGERLGLYWKKRQPSDHQRQSIESIDPVQTRVSSQSIIPMKILSVNIRGLGAIKKKERKNTIKGLEINGVWEDDLGHVTDHIFNFFGTKLLVPMEKRRHFIANERREYR